MRVGDLKRVMDATMQQNLGELLDFNNPLFINNLRDLRHQSLFEGGDISNSAPLCQELVQGSPKKQWVNIQLE